LPVRDEMLLLRGEMGGEAYVWAACSGIDSGVTARIVYVLRWSSREPMAAAASVSNSLLLRLLWRAGSGMAN
jgi:hypothetical protein